MSRSLRALLVALLALVWLAPAAAAQEDGVFVDPESPTGKEYAIPLDSARRQADPSGADGNAAPGAAPEAAPLFGAGIGASAGADAQDVDAQTDTSEPGGGGAQAQAPGEDVPAAPASSSGDDAVVKAATLNPGAPSGGIGTSLVIALAAAGLLLAGVLAGVIIRHKRG